MRVHARMLMVVGCVCVSAFLFVHWLEWRRPVRITHAPPPPAPAGTTKLILSWVPIYGDPYYYFGAGRHAFVDHGCSVSACEITDDRFRLPQHHFDALLFHGYEFSELLSGKPRHRSPHQLYVFMSLEPARRTSVPEHLRYFYNVTLTYRLDSDIPWPYFVVRDRASGARVAPALDVRWREPAAPPLDRPDWRRTLDTIRGKARPARAAWFVSDCKSNSGREALAHELGKYMPVDIYGKCGQYDCPSAAHPNCSRLLAERYHFYLAFENSLCQDYQTEKVLHALSASVVPVILSGAQLSRFLPPRSYISASGVPPAQLAAQLARLADEPQLFVQYLWWRDYYTIESVWSSTASGGDHPLCRLCALLHAPPAPRQRDIIEWWIGEGANSTCV